jgi:hypothetical protein
MATHIIPVQGTHAYRSTTDGDEWWQRGSRFMRHAESRSVFPFDPDDPFLWCTSLDGILGENSHWRAGGLALFWYLSRIPYHMRRLLLHSHAIELLIVAASHEAQRRAELRARGVRVDDGPFICRAVTVCGPVRDDMMADARIAASNIGRWRHVYSTDDDDKWQRWGEFGDGHVGIVRQHPCAHENEGVPNMNHSRALNEPEMFAETVDGWFDFLGGADEQQRAA